MPRRRFCAARDGAEVILGFRPEHVGRAIGESKPDGVARIESTIELVQPTGSRSYATLDMAGQPIMAELQAHDPGRAGERIQADINLRAAVLFDPDSQKAL